MLLATLASAPFLAATQVAGLPPEPPSPAACVNLTSAEIVEAISNSEISIYDAGGKFSVSYYFISSTKVTIYHSLGLPGTLNYIVSNNSIIINGGDPKYLCRFRGMLFLRYESKGYTRYVERKIVKRLM